jgi:BMFP domain-containing protein YqiC
MTLLLRRRERRERALEARVGKVEKRLDDLAEKVTTAGD